MYSRLLSTGQRTLRSANQPLDKDSVVTKRMLIPVIDFTPDWHSCSPAHYCSDRIITFVLFRAPQLLFLYSLAPRFCFFPFSS